MQSLQQPKEIETLGYKLSPGQLNIVASILDPTLKRVVISCMTRYGKTRVAAIALLLYILTNTNKRVLIIAPTIDQTNIIRNYMAEMIAENPTLSSLVDHTTHTGPEHLKSEMSKKRVTFKNGCELITLTAYGNENESDPAPNLMGFGGDIIVLDEADLILRKVYTQRISRMLGDSPNSKLITIVNPWNITNFAFEQWQNPTFKKIHVDWRQALTEKRTTQTYLDEQKALLSDYEWTVLYESKWSNESEDTLIRYDWILRATKKQIQFTTPTQTVWGLDVAEQGADLTVLTNAETDGTQYKIISQQHLLERETMATANHVNLIVPLTERLNIDSIGVGAGVYSRLTELKHSTYSIRVGEAPLDTYNSKRFMNLKSQRWWRIRELFEKDLISIPNNPKLISQLSQMRYEFTTLSKIKIKDPEGKSPDYADSLMLTPLPPHAQPQVLTGKSIFG
jgi:hypothetical protein